MKHPEIIKILPFVLVQKPYFNSILELLGFLVEFDGIFIFKYFFSFYLFIKQLTVIFELSEGLLVDSINSFLEGRKVLNHLNRTRRI